MSVGLLFPGQGAQHVGMGRELADAHPVAARTFEEADDVLGFSLSRLMWEGPAEALTSTENAQPALYAHSTAAFRVVRERLGPVAAAAGHSLGELSAHCAGGTWSFADGLRAVRHRGELMARANDTVPGTMAAVLGMELKAVAELCDDARRAGMVVVPANLNAPGQVVVSGEVAAVERLAAAAKEREARKVVALDVSAAFHSPLMGPVADEFGERLAATPMKPPAFPVVSNVTAEAVPQDADSIRELLVRQLTSPVRWAECVARMVELGASRFVELGPGKILTGLNRRNAKGAPTDALGTAAAVAALEAAESAGGGR